MNSREAIVSARIILFLFLALLCAALGMLPPVGIAFAGAGIEVYKYVAFRRGK